MLPVNALVTVLIAPLATVETASTAIDALFCAKKALYWSILNAHCGNPVNVSFSAVLKKITVFFKSRVDVVHVSFDMDVIDPMFAPGVGIPLPGGLNYREALLLMEEMSSTGMVASAEFVEVNPVLDVRSQTASMAVELMARLLGDVIY